MALALEILIKIIEIEEIRQKALSVYSKRHVIEQFF